ncbi:hypothetical protein DY000_02057312 [Brassica cretica]|uniref:Uncharacterized protein n=1 Tax=Brassica cretica TaxID=69181 RepID=A0ABQ7AJS5_BRACR|nr:hypothetical protein DY000_02057312 [Brassica cretica]
MFIPNHSSPQSQTTERTTYKPTSSKSPPPQQLTKLNRRLEHEHGSERLKKRKGRLRKYRQKSVKRHWIFVHWPSSFTISQPTGDSGGSSGGVAPLTGDSSEQLLPPICRNQTLRYTIQPLPEIHFKTHHCPRTGAYSSIPAVQAPTSPPHHNDSPLSPSPSVEHSELQEVARKRLRLRSQDES